MPLQERLETYSAITHDIFFLRDSRASYASQHHHLLFSRSYSNTLVFLNAYIGLVIFRYPKTHFLIRGRVGETGLIGFIVSLAILVPFCVNTHIPSILPMEPE